MSASRYPQSDGWHISEAGVAALKDGTLGDLLDEDMRTYGAKCIEDGWSAAESAVIAGPLVLQCFTLTNVAQPSTRQEGGSRLLMLRLTDGHLKISGIEYEQLRGLTAGSPPGFKVLLRSAVIKRGKILLTPANCKVLGGRVSSLVQAWLANREVEARRRLGEAIAASTNAAATGEEGATVIKEKLPTTTAQHDADVLAVALGGANATSTDLVAAAATMTKPPAFVPFDQAKLNKQSSSAGAGGKTQAAKPESSCSKPAGGSAPTGHSAPAVASAAARSETAKGSSKHTADRDKALSLVDRRQASETEATKGKKPAAETSIKKEKDAKTSGGDVRASRATTACRAGTIAYSSEEAAVTSPAPQTPGSRTSTFSSLNAGAAAYRPPAHAASAADTAVDCEPPAAIGVSKRNNRRLLFDTGLAGAATNNSRITSSSTSATSSSNTLEAPALSDASVHVKRKGRGSFNTGLTAEAATAVVERDATGRQMPSTTATAAATDGSGYGYGYGFGARGSAGGSYGSGSAALPASGYGYGSRARQQHDYARQHYERPAAAGGGAAQQQQQQQGSGLASFLQGGLTAATATVPLPHAAAAPPTAAAAADSYPSHTEQHEAGISNTSSNTSSSSSSSSRRGRGGARAGTHSSRPTAPAAPPPAAASTAQQEAEDFWGSDEPPRPPRGVEALQRYKAKQAEKTAQATQSGDAVVPSRGRSGPGAGIPAAAVAVAGPSEPARQAPPRSAVISLPVPDGYDHPHSIELAVAAADRTGASREPLFGGWAGRDRQFEQPLLNAAAVAPAYAHNAAYAAGHAAIGGASDASRSRMREGPRTRGRGGHAADRGGGHAADRGGGHAADRGGGRRREREPEGAIGASGDAPSSATNLTLAAFF